MAEFSSLNGYQVKDVTARNIAKGRNQAVAFRNYYGMMTALKKADKDQYKVGQNIYLAEVGVPDLWIHTVGDIFHDYQYTSDAAMLKQLETNATIQIGYYTLAMLETQKVDLTPYDTKLAEHDANFNNIETRFSGLKLNNSGYAIKIESMYVETNDSGVAALQINNKYIKPTNVTVIAAYVDSCNNGDQIVKLVTIGTNKSGNWIIRLSDASGEPIKTKGNIDFIYITPALYGLDTDEGITL